MTDAAPAGAAVPPLMRRRSSSFDMAAPADDEAASAAAAAPRAARPSRGSRLGAQMGRTASGESSAKPAQPVVAEEPARKRGAVAAMAARWGSTAGSSSTAAPAPATSTGASSSRSAAPGRTSLSQAFDLASSSAAQASTSAAAAAPSITTPPRRLTRSGSHGDLLGSLSQVASPERIAEEEAAGPSSSPSGATPTSAPPAGAAVAGRLQRLPYSNRDSFLPAPAAEGLATGRASDAAAPEPPGGILSAVPAHARPGLLARTSSPNLGGDVRRTAGASVASSRGREELAAQHLQQTAHSVQPRKLSGVQHRELLLPSLAGSSAGASGSRAFAAAPAREREQDTHGGGESAAAAAAATYRQQQDAYRREQEASKVALQQSASSPPNPREREWEREAYTRRDRGENGREARSHQTAPSLGGSSESGSTSSAAHGMGFTALRSGSSSTAQAQGATRSASRSSTHNASPSPRPGQMSDAAILELGAVPGAPAAAGPLQPGVPLSSKNVLTIALQKAQSAVLLDSANNVPEAIAAYKQAVRLLQEVMERIAPRNSQRRTKVTREEERRRLKVIHDTYADRIRLLALIYSPESDLSSDGSDNGEHSDRTPRRPSVQQWSSTEAGRSSEHGSPSMSTRQGGTFGGAPSPALSNGLALAARQRGREESAAAAAASSSSNARAVPTPAISIQRERAPDPRSPVERDEMLLEASAGARAEHGRSDSEGSFRSANGLAATSSQSSGLRLPEPTRHAALQRSLGIDEEVRTPATPYFDIDPNLVAQDVATPRLDEVAHLQQRDSAPPQRSAPPPRAHSPRTAGSRTAGSLSHIPSPLGIEAELDSAQRREPRPSSEGSAPPERGSANETQRPVVASPPPAPQPRQSVDMLRLQSSSSSSSSSSARARAATVGRESSPEHRLLVSPTVSSGTISQRRKHLGGAAGGDGSLSVAMPSSGALSSTEPSPLATPTLEAAELPHMPQRRPRGGEADSTSGDSSLGRKRALSQPGNRRPAMPSGFMPPVDSSPPPAVPRITRKASMPAASPTMPSAPGGSAPALRIAPPGQADGGQSSFLHTLSSSPGYHSLEPPSSPVSALHPSAANSGISGHGGDARTPSFATLFPTGLPSAAVVPSAVSFNSANKVLVLPWLGVGGGPAETSVMPAVPAAPALRPFHLMRQLHLSIVRGAFISRRLYVPKELWVQPGAGAKLQAIEAKVRMLDVVAGAIDALEQAGHALLNPPAGQPGLGIAHAARFAKQLEDFDAVLVEVQNSLARKLGFLETVAGKKANTSLGAFGSKLTRSLDRMTNGSKHSDSPASYIEALARLFSRSQVLGTHLQALLQSRQPPGASAPAAGVETYAALPHELRAVVETKLRRCADFFANVVLRIVVRDLHVLLEKSAKRAHAAFID